ncbi:hypothetical protein DL546_005974 [Coniochaeta pulveracea]|uniref:Uncharacterized protein n=1 Tax=Coniochaeta pulveracea TaxID=177199 RepID=A0A420YCE2_9PEZI|nr:hypothetical protein DL546_005974 [Coniochaeta pulveracea]
MPNRRHNSREYGTNQPSYTNTHTQYPNNVAANETYDNDHHYTNPDAHYTYEPIQSRHNVNTGYTFTHDHPGTQGYAATGQQGRSTGDHEPMAYQQPPYQQQANYGFVDQQQETFHQPSADEHQPTEEQQPRHQQQPTHRQDSAGQQRKPSYQSSAYEHQPTEQQQLMGHDEPHRYTESPSTQQTDTYTPPSTIDLSTGPAHSVTPTPRTWTGSSLDVNIPE